MAFDVRAPESLAWIAGHPWAYPALETVHLAGMALLVGNLAALELRVWGRAREQPPRDGRSHLGLGAAADIHPDVPHIDRLFLVVATAGQAAQRPALIWRHQVIAQRV